MSYAERRDYLRDYMREYLPGWREQNAVRYLESQREYTRRWRQQHPEEAAERARAWREKNLEKVRAADRQRDRSEDRVAYRRALYFSRQEKETFGRECFLQAQLFEAVRQEAAPQSGE